jgi:hypothetical protein
MPEEQEPRKTAAARVRALRERRKLDQRLVKVRVNLATITWLEQHRYFEGPPPHSDKALAAAVEMLLSDVPHMCGCRLCNGVTLCAGPQ